MKKEDCEKIVQQKKIVAEIIDNIYKMSGLQLDTFEVYPNLHADTWKKINDFDVEIEPNSVICIGIKYGKAKLFSVPTFCFLITFDRLYITGLTRQEGYRNVPYGLKYERINSINYDSLETKSLFGKSKEENILTIVDNENKKYIINNNLISKELCSFFQAIVEKEVQSYIIKTEDNELKTWKEKIEDIENKYYLKYNTNPFVTSPFNYSQEKLNSLIINEFPEEYKENALVIFPISHAKDIFFFRDYVIYYKKNSYKKMQYSQIKNITLEYKTESRVDEFSNIKHDEIRTVSFLSSNNTLFSYSIKGLELSTEYSLKWISEDKEEVSYPPTDAVIFTLKKIISIIKGSELQDKQNIDITLNEKPFNDENNKENLKLLNILLTKWNEIFTREFSLKNVFNSEGDKALDKMEDYEEEINENSNISYISLSDCYNQYVEQVLPQDCNFSLYKDDNKQLKTAESNFVIDYDNSKDDPVKTTSNDIVFLYQPDINDKTKKMLLLSLSKYDHQKKRNNKDVIFESYISLTFAIKSDSSNKSINLYGNYDNFFMNIGSSDFQNNMNIFIEKLHNSNKLASSRSSSNLEDDISNW